MKRLLILLLASVVALCAQTSRAQEHETFQLWPDVAPGEKADAEKPTYEYWKPENKTSDACVIVCPGGGYNMLCRDYEGQDIASYFNSKGVTAVVLYYRVPRREGQPKHLAPWQDAQRCVRVVRSRADEWGINPDKIGILGFSAGGHLTLMTSTTSLTNSYEPVDEIDKLSASVNFAVPVYPAYVLEDGVEGTNTNKGADSPIVDDFAFDAKTPPMCFIHGDADRISPMGSAMVYAQLRKMDIPAELHVYAKVEHGFGANVTDNHVGDWLNRVYYWMQAMGF
ncbi:MAG: prolyl oligopeptidase family serine peptidase [Thermoguttaceae bacterium]|jgi:acetyl esterase/lipase